MDERWAALRYHALRFAGGAIALSLTVCGCIASIMLDYRSIEDACLGLCLTLTH
jgi:hypothetical protein